MIHILMRAFQLVDDIRHTESELGSPCVFQAAAVAVIMQLVRNKSMVRCIFGTGFRGRRGV